MFFFKKLWASWFGKRTTPRISFAEAQRRAAEMRQQAMVKDAVDKAIQRARVKAPEAHRPAGRYTPTSPTPARPSEDAMDGSSGIGITEAIIMAEILTSDSNVVANSETPITNDDSLASGLGSDNDLPWSGDGGSSGGAGAEGSCDSGSSDWS